MSREFGQMSLPCKCISVAFSVFQRAEYRQVYNPDCTMEARQRNFVTIFLLFLGLAIGYGGKHTPFYNEECSVPDLSEQCQTICNEKLYDCVIDCGNDEVTG